MRRHQQRFVETVSADLTPHEHEHVFSPHAHVSAHFYRVPLAVPYWSGATYRAVIRCLTSGSIVDGPDLIELRSSIVQELAAAAAILCGSGSLALELALRACGVRPGDAVVIPSFCCTSVVAPITAIGAVPLLADIGEELNLTPATVAAALTGKTTAVIVPHLFGNPADIGAIVDLARSRGIRVIDDAAQALGATIDGRPAGSFGDAGIVSFGAEKICFGLGGGVVVSRDRDLFNEISKIELSPPSFPAVVRHFFSTLIRRHWRRWTLPVFEWFSSGEAGPDTPPVPYKHEAMANLNAAVASTLIETLRENIAARRARVRAYRDLLAGDERLELMPHRSGSACLTQVVRVLPQRRGDDAAARLIEVLAAAAYEIQGSYVPIHLLPAYQRFATKHLQRTEEVWSDLIELPCEPSVNLDDVEKIAATIKRALS